MKKQTSLLILGGMAALLMAGSCSRKIYVPVERVMVHRDTSHTTAIRIDTVVRADSVVISRSGDTVYHTAWRVRERVSRHTDTIERVIHDTLLTTHAVATEPESPTRPGIMERLRHSASQLLASIGLIALILLIIRIVYRRISRRDT